MADPRKIAAEADSAFFFAMGCTLAIPISAFIFDDARHGLVAAYIAIIWRMMAHAKRVRAILEGGEG